MAEVATMPSTNGNGYAPHQGYGGIEQQGGNPYSSTPASTQSMYPQPAAQEMASSTSSQSDIPKDEVGWYFVEQYYTTLSRSPEKLYLFYNKRSQFVSGQETDKVPVCIGQRAINDRIKELDYHDCKVRVTNVDSQASDANIVIQVVGEISNNSQPHKKFAQTFVLATQTNGYFVLNDIFRYLIEEEEEEQPQAQPEPEPEVAPQIEEEVQKVPEAETAGQEAPETAEETTKDAPASAEDPLAVEPDAEQVDKELEEKVVHAEEPAPTVNGDAESEHAEAEPVEGAATGAAVEESKSEPEAEPELSQQDTKEADVQAEKPKDPAPSPAAAPPAAQAPAQPTAPPKPAAPKTWASLAASANRVATPVTPQPPTQPRQTAPAAKSQPAPSPAPTPAAPAPTASGTAPTAPAPPVNESKPSEPQDEWVAVQGHNRQQSRQQQPQVEQAQNRGYIKNVHEGIEFSELESQMKQFGELLYFDIARQKSCAFVDFRTAEQYNAAVAANPHTIGNDKLYVEERRIRPGTTPFIPRGGPYGRGGGRGGAGQGAPRGDFGGRGRGGYAPRGARGGAPRGGRGGAPQA